MNKIIGILLLSFFAIFLCAGSASATAFNDNRPLTLGTSGEQSLQTIFNNNIINGTLDAYNDQSNVALWTPDEANVDAYFITRFAGDSGNLGIYSATTGAEYDFVFSPTGTASFTINNSGELWVGGSLQNSTFGDEFGFYWRDTTVPNQSYTEDSKNSGGAGPDNNILALSYLVPTDFLVLTSLANGTTVRADGDNDWILAFEDRLAGDNDFNDAVFYVEDIEPVPEPATMLLVGSGLIGLAAAGRKKFLKKS